MFCLKCFKNKKKNCKIFKGYNEFLSKFSFNLHFSDNFYPHSHFHFVLSQIDSGTSTILIGENIVNLNKLGIFCQYTCTGK